MPTKPREWPNNAREARDRAAEEANKAIRALSPMLDRQMTQEEVIRRTAIALNSSHTIARLMENNGAQTTPPGEFEGGF
jgi:hypothetical protein